MSDEARMMEIEIKVARQEDLLDTLNTLVYRSSKRSTSWKPCARRWRG